MCGHFIEVNERPCPSCGETLQTPPADTTLADIVLALGFGGLSVLICGFFYWEFIRACIWPVNVDHYWMVQILDLFAGCLVTAWLWGPPAFVITYLPRSPTRSKTPVSVCRQFWQIQAIMLAISLALLLLCVLSRAIR